MKTIASSAKPENANLARAKLEGSGVPTFVRDEHTVSLYWLYSNAIGGVRVEVGDQDFERAREILDLSPVAEGLLSCPHCGSTNVRLRELSAWTAISIALGFVLPIKSRKADCIACKRSFEIPEEH